MSTNVDCLIGMLDNTRVFQSKDIRALNELLSKARAEEIPDNYREDLLDLIDMMFMCGNVYAHTGGQIDQLHDSLIK